MEGIKFSTYKFITIALLLFCSSCSVNKYLNEEDYLITKNTVILTDTEKAVKEKSQLKYELSTLISQEPNSKLLFFFRPELHWYFKNELKKEEKLLKFEQKFNRKKNRLEEKLANKTQNIERNGSGDELEEWNIKAKKKRQKIDKKKNRRTNIKEFINRKRTQEPVLYDKITMERTAKSMENYLAHKGFLDAKVYPSNKLKNRNKANITYEAFPGNLYKVDTLIYESKDSTLAALTPWISKETLFKKGTPIDGNIYNQEVNRITDSLRNNGYAYFFTNNIKKLDIDTTGYGYDLTVYDGLTKPYNSEVHKQYRIGKINVYPNFNGELGAVHSDTLIDGIHYKTLDGDIGIKPSLLRGNIYLNEGDVFNQSLIDNTNTQLNALGLYKFVNIRTNASADEDGKIDVEIILSKLKKQNITMDADINNSERVLTNNRNFFFGNAVNLSYLNRNTFNGAERFSASLEGGVEFNLTDRSQLINSLDFTGRVDLRLPEFIDFPGTWKLLSLIKFGNWSLINQDFLNDMRRDGIPTVSGTYNSFSLRNFYSYNSFDLALTYDLKRSATEKYTVKTFDITLFQSQTEPAFDTILLSNPLLEERLSPRLITGFFYSEFNYLWTSPQNNLGETWQWRFNHELSGAEALLANYIINGGRSAINLPNNLEFAHYNKFDVDIRYFKEFRDGNIFGLRAHAGIAIPFSKFSETVPFVKQFFVGGPNSIRAWRIREPGPGEYIAPPSLPNTPFFQTGDFLFEFNLEYRFKFIPFLNMDAAVFLDGGNIWTLKEDTDRPGSQLLWRSTINSDGDLVGDNFIDQLSLGTGFGVRIDFNYFVLTVDLGLKLLNSFEYNNGSRWFFDDFRGNGGLRRALNPNLLFGYPF